MRGAIERRAQGARLVFEPIEHVVHGDRKGIELVVSASNRQPATQLARENPLAGACYIANTTRQPVTEPESGECGGERRQPDTPQHGDPKLLREAASLRN